MSSPGYVWEKMYVAVDCLCREGSLKERLENATISALLRLNDDDLTGEPANDLKYVLDWTKRNIVNGELQRQPDEIETKRLVEKMLSILLDTTKHAIGG
jgi:hypothetical protein